MIEGHLIQLCPATLDDRRMILEWSNSSDIAPWLHLSDDPAQPTGAWGDDYWEEYYYTGHSPELGRFYIIQAEGHPVGVIAYNDIDANKRVELDIWMNAEANCGKGFGVEAIQILCAYLQAAFGVRTFMMQPSARNPRAIRAYEKAGFVKMPATPEQIAAAWSGVDHHDSVLMIREVA